MRAPLTHALAGLVGITVGMALMAILAQRSDYYAQEERIAEISSELERSAKSLLAKGDREGAATDFAAAIAIRNRLAVPDEPRPLTDGLSMIPEVLVSPLRPSMQTHEAYGDPGVSFMYECALVQVAYRDDDIDGRTRAFAKIKARYPKSNAANCEALGKTFWAK